jgi:hypothetical protein
MHSTLMWLWRTRCDAYTLLPSFITGPAQGYGMFAVSLKRYPHVERLLFGYNRAIDIADKFPNAQVTAVDISPMIPRFASTSLSMRFPY